MHCKASRSFIHTVELKHAIADNNLSLPFEFWSDHDDFNDTDSEIGNIFEIDLEYPKELHDKHNDYPLLPEARTIKLNELSEVSKNIYKSLNNKQARDGKSKKLILDFNAKHKYVIHISKLKEDIKKGIRLKKIHRCISFKQKAWLVFLKNRES